MGILIEQYAGAFPTWLAPVQIKILPVTDRANEYAKELVSKLKDEDIRVEMDLRNEKIGYKIREAQLQKIPYMIILGDKEVEAGNLAIRSRKEGDLGTMEFGDFFLKIKEEVDKKLSNV
jgi:threonyl-tRNA synthetase